jgi:hypothetical protein
MFNGYEMKSMEFGTWNDMNQENGLNMDGMLVMIMSRMICSILKSDLISVHTN